MQSQELGILFSKLSRLLLEANAAPAALWKSVLELTGQQENAELASFDLESYSELLTAQVQRVVLAQPFPDDLSFLYFGLFDISKNGANPHHSSVGFYIAGGTAPNAKEAIEGGDLTYFPENRFLRIDVLDRIKELGNKAQLFDYLIIFGAAAIVAKAAVANLRLSAPLYVGFDSGDYALIANGPKQER